jgi:pimeloyl-ACP methyl ester carboxylesterase
MPTTSPYSGLPNKLVRAANGVDYAYRDTGPEASGPGVSNTVPLVLFQHFRGNLDSWDPALIDALATDRRVITFDNAGVGGSTGTTPGQRGADGPRRHRLHRHHGTRPG